MKRRLVCMIYEAVLVFGVTVVAACMFYGVAWIFGVKFVAYAQTNNSDIVHHALQAWIIFILGLYFVYCWHKSGQTLALKTWRIRVVDLDGGRVPLIKAIVRYCLAWMWFLPALILVSRFELKSWSQIGAVLAGGVALWAMTALLDKDGQFLHDKLAKTRLMHVELDPNVDHKYIR
ncbi:RDD family protein [Undibacterium sp.]|jgi:uncharacterized RDD family membrane protein YckC|uniref:RDD family protein n=1 Tax=Undibacterium sp. TaxID=1914977 RepID=UPI002CF5159A|nr:RDD family protein [Undibacterium sp.]HTD03985.1 RDD family protein [Undibacterium sp.]